MNSPADSVVAYILAKDGNRPHLLEAAFAVDAQLRMEVLTNAISFPSEAKGRGALADILVRRFNQAYENIYTFCLGAPPQPGAQSFSCSWLVAMSDKESGAARVGCGLYVWSFAPIDWTVTQLFIRIDAMEVLPPASLGAITEWASMLPYPWCPMHVATAALPNIGQLDTVARALDLASRPITPKNVGHSA